MLQKIEKELPVDCVKGLGDVDLEQNGFAFACM